MNKLLYTIIIWCFTVATYAQQSIGIGTETPNASALLDVSSTTKGLLIPRMTTAQRNAIITPATGLLVFDISLASFQFYNGTSWISIGATAPSYWAISGINIYSTNSGNVGLGTAAPTEKLSINNGKIFLKDNRTDNSPHLIFDAPAVNYKQGGLQWKRNADTMAALNYIADPNRPNYLSLSVKNSGTAPDLVVNSNGYIGMGISNPLSNLHLYDYRGVEMVRVEGSAPLIQLRRRTTADNQIPTVFKDIGFIQTSGDNLRLGTNSDNESGDFVIRTNGADRVFVDQSGNVSIGTPDVAAGYKVSVAGKIMCEELRVLLKAGWPDYVFEDNYTLMPLNKLHNYIRTHKHLPNIPAAKEVENSGIELGEMQRKMMEKIEELTLYIIDLQHQITDLKAIQK